MTTTPEQVASSPDQSNYDGQFGQAIYDAIYALKDEEFAVSTNLTHKVAQSLHTQGYRQVFDGDCGLSSIKAPDDREAAEAWMRWANLAMNEDVGAIYAMQKMLTELGYRKPREVKTVEELAALPVESVVRSHAGIIYEKYWDEDGREYDYWLIPGEQRAQADTKVDLPATLLHEGAK